MRCSTWNVNGIRALEKKGALPWEVLSDSDVLCLQETRALPEQLPPALTEPEGWHTHWFGAKRKGYSGVAMLSRAAPDEVLQGVGDPRFDDEGRLLALRFGELIVASAYFPNSQEGGQRLDYKLGFCAAIETTLNRWAKAGRQVLLMGDYNIAHRPIDLARPKENEESPGYLPEERAWMSRYLDLGYLDLFRELHPEARDSYTWWSFRSRARERNIGWRLDYGTSTPGLRDRLVAVDHRTDVVGSDHCPVTVTLR